MRKIYNLFIFIFILIIPFSVHSQTILEADGPGNTYELINSVFAPGYDVVENPECAHPQFGRHIAEVWDADLNRYVFEFYIHVTPDNDRCINFDRQRMEIKTYDASPDNLKGISGEKVTYKWKFKVPQGFQPSSNFTHIHQIKAVGGNDDDPLFTFTPRKGSPNKMELIHNNTTKLAIIDLASLEGTWVEATETILIDSLHGTYSLRIKKVSDGTLLLAYTNNNLMTIRYNNTFIRPKWGIYRSLLNSQDLRDESLRFAGFSIQEGDVLNEQNINFLPLPNKTFGDLDFSPNATATSTLPVTYVSSNTSVATILDGKIHIVKPGTAIITASQAGNSSFKAAPDVSQTLIVSKANQTITFDALPAKSLTDADFNPAAKASSKLPVTYTSSNSLVATLINGNIHITGIGTSTITASQSGDDWYLPATNITQLLTVSTMQSQSITFPVISKKVFGDADFSLNATSNSGLTVSYTSSNINVATIVNNKIHIVGAGNSTISAIQTGDAVYNPAITVSQILEVAKKSQTIMFPELPFKFIGDIDFNPGATASSGLPVSYTSTNPAVASILNGMIHIVGVGTSFITATQDGNSNFEGAGNVNQLLTIAVKTSIPSYVNNDVNLEIFPNPCLDILNIQYVISKESIVQIFIYNQVGQIVQIISNSKLQLPGKYVQFVDGNDLEEGMYFVKINTDYFSISKKLIRLK